MSMPEEKAVESILARIVATLNEWDDSSYAIVIRSKDENWHYALKSSPEDSALIAHGLLDLAIRVNETEEEDS